MFFYSFQMILLFIAMIIRMGQINISIVDMISSY